MPTAQDRIRGWSQRPGGEQLQGPGRHAATPQLPGTQTGHRCGIPSPGRKLRGWRKGTRGWVALPKPTGCPGSFLPPPCATCQMCAEPAGPGVRKLQGTLPPLADAPQGGQDRSGRRGHGHQEAERVRGPLGASPARRPSGLWAAGPWSRGGLSSGQGQAALSLSHDRNRTAHSPFYKSSMKGQFTEVWVACRTAGEREGATMTGTWGEGTLGRGTGGSPQLPCREGHPVLSAGRSHQEVREPHPLVL